MKKLFGCFLLTLWFFSANGQIIYFETGKLFSTIRYKDSNGTKLDNLKGTSENSLALGFRHAIGSSKFNYLAGVSYNRYGAKGSNPVLGNYYEWDVKYAGINLGLDFDFFRPKVINNNQSGLSLCIRTTISPEFFLDGYQNLNDRIYDLKGAEDFDKPLYFLRGGVVLSYYISRSFIIYGSYMGGTNILIGDYKGQEQLHFNANNLSIGVAINLKNVL
jgi:hypothetical protein